MEKIGRIIRMPITKRNGMQIATVEYDTPEAELCSIKSTDSRSGCASCGGGCHACGKSTCRKDKRNPHCTKPLKSGGLLGNKDADLVPNP